MIDILADEALASLLITLYLTQVSFGTACNVFGDDAIASIVDIFYGKYIKKVIKNKSIIYKLDNRRKRYGIS